jgi:hypothetical protein
MATDLLQMKVDEQAAGKSEYKGTDVLLLRAGLQSQIRSESQQYAK